MRDRYYLNLYRHASQRAREHDRELIKFKVKFKREHCGRRSKTVPLDYASRHLTKSVINFSKALRQNRECARAMFKRSRIKEKAAQLPRVCLNAHCFLIKPTIENEKLLFFSRPTRVVGWPEVSRRKKEIKPRLINSDCINWRVSRGNRSARFLANFQKIK